MGQKCMKLSKCDEKEVDILMVGLDGVGKTTILYQLQLGEVIKSTPTLGFEVETVRFNDISLIVWDIGGQINVRHLWSEYASKAKAKAVVFVVDSSDRGRVKEAKKMLHEIVEDATFTKLPLLVFANKQDFLNTMSVDEITDKLGLQLLGFQKWHIQTSCATSNEGLFEGFEWLCHNLH